MGSWDSHGQNLSKVSVFFKVTDAVHAKGSFIFAQLWALGRMAKATILEKSGFDYVAASDISLDGIQIPRHLRTEGAFSFFLLLIASHHPLQKSKNTFSFLPKLL